MSEEKKLDFYINKYITYYKNNFSKIWEDENFKWKAIKCFQDNWDINAKDFLKMLDNSFAQTYNLLSSNQYFPLKMIKLYANYDCQKVRAMFLDLYNEDKDIIERISNFKKSSEDLCNMYTPGYQHYQKENAITVYLWLKNPDKYYIFKFGEIKSVAEKLHSEYDFRKGAYENNIRNHIKLYDLICNILQDDFELKKIFYSHLDETCYQDPYMKTLTIDFGYYVANIDSKIAIENIEVNNKLQSKNYPQLKNQILYGPPGTGKTYNTVIKAIEITNPELIQKDKDGNVENYELLKEKFDELKQQGQIEFVTFHQSYSYEEFVEGIKPYIPDWGNVEENNRFIGQDGIFKRIAKDALYSSLTLNNNNNNDSEFFYRIIEKFKEEYPIGSILQTQENNNFEIVNYTETSIRIQPVTEKRSKLSISYQPLEEMYLLNKKNKISTRKELEIAMNDRYKGLSSYYLPILKIIENFKLDDKNIKQGKEFKEKLIKEFYQNKMVLKKNNELRYVLVIDEINRGDVSKIFGELITLIEEDKRIGEDHQMTVTLPYSREPFGVPNNLYIIGTMNTADRSIALLDTALRRRFDFEEMMPTPELLSENVEGVDLAQLLTQINDRIKKDYDKDHQIGHSYLMGVKNKEQLERAYKNRILPLLNEYFYNDIDSIAKVLNCKPDEISSKENWFNVLKEAQKPTKKDNEQ